MHWYNVAGIIHVNIYLLHSQLWWKWWWKTDRKQLFPADGHSQTETVVVHKRKYCVGGAGIEERDYIRTSILQTIAQFSSDASTVRISHTHALAAALDL